MFLIFFRPKETKKISRTSEKKKKERRYLTPKRYAGKLLLAYTKKIIGAYPSPESNCCDSKTSFCCLSYFLSINMLLWGPWPLSRSLLVPKAIEILRVTFGTARAALLSRRLCVPASSSCCVRSFQTNKQQTSSTQVANNSKQASNEQQTNNKQAANNQRTSSKQTSTHAANAQPL